MKKLIISFVCADRAGLVNELSQVIKSHQGNWQASSLHALSGHFTGALEVAVAASQCDELVSAIKAIDGIDSIIKISESVPSKVKPTVILDLTANDRSGIIQEISSTIHHQGGNLLKLVSKTQSAPHSGSELFKAKVTVAVEDNAVDALVNAIENLADDLIVDISH